MLNTLQTANSFTASENVSVIYWEPKPHLQAFNCMILLLYIFMVCMFQIFIISPRCLDTSSSD